MYAKAIQFEHYCRVTIVLSVLATVLFMFLYGAFLMLAVNRTALRSQAETGIAQLSSEMGTLQARYLSVMQQLTPDRAVALGFVQPRPADVTYFDASARGLSLNTVQ